METVVVHRMLQFMDALVPPDPGWSLVERTRVRLILALSLVLGALTPVTLMGHLLMGASWAMTLGMTATVSVTLIPAAVLIVYRNRTTAATLLCLIGLSSTSVLAWFHGGIQSPVTLSLGLVPMLAVACCTPTQAFTIWLLTVTSLFGLYEASVRQLTPALFDQDSVHLANLWMWNQLCFQVIGIAITGLLQQVASRTVSEVERVNLELASAHTITEAARRQAEDARQLAEQLAMRRSEFLATMSHELRTPLNGIIGTLQLFPFAESPAAQAQLVHIAAQSARSLSTIIDDVLDVSKLERGALVLESTCFSITSLVEDVVALLRPGLRSADVTLSVTIDPNVPPQVFGDPNRTRQVLFNLVGNAIKFTARGRVDVGVRHERDTAVLTVRDTGIGIARDKLELIFEPFTQADVSTTRRYGGTGLGLNISHRLAQAMGGSISVVSELGEGSTFTLRLPAREATTAPPRQVEPPRIIDHGAKLRVLVAEDNRVNQIVIQGMLTRLGHSVHLTSDGQEAVQAWTDGAWDLVLLDWHMPKLDGLGACSQIRATPAGSSVMILAMTASVMENEQTACVRAGMDGVLLKPLTLDALENAIAACQTRIAPREPPASSTSAFPAPPPEAAIAQHPTGNRDATAPHPVQGLEHPPATEEAGAFALRTPPRPG